MRISDWSSDVCSSDLAVTRDGCCALPTQRERRRRRLRVKLGAPPLLAASMADHPRIAFLASRAEPAQQALAALVDVHGQYAPEDAEVLCVLGGDRKSVV